MLSREMLRQSLNDEKRRRQIKKCVPRAYERFFEGYRIDFIAGKPGKKGNIKRVYTGDYYCCNLTASGRRTVKLIYVLLLAASVYFYAAAALENIHSNTVWYGVLPQAALIAAFVWTGSGIGNLLLGRKLLTVHEYKTSVGFIRKGTAAASVCAVLAAAAAAADALLTGGAGSFWPVSSGGVSLTEAVFDGSLSISVTGFAASALCTGALGCIERKISYQKIPSKESTSLI